MEIISSARKLQKLLITHDKAAHQIDLLDIQICQISRRLMLNDIGLHSADMTSQYLRLSIARAVRHMLEKFRQLCVSRVQKLSRSILSYLQTDDRSDTNLSSADTVNASVPMDIAASKYTSTVMPSLRAD